MRVYILLCLLLPLQVAGAVLKGRVTDHTGEALAFASVYIKGSTSGTTTNLDGYYKLELPAGSYTVICQYIGYKKEEIQLKLEGDVTKNFRLGSNENTLKEIVIKQGENPALAIIRKTIKKRAFYNKQIDRFKADAYIKGSIRLDDVESASFLVNMLRVTEGGSDTAMKQELEKQKGLIYLSESLSEVAYKRPGKLKTIVKSSRVSGATNSYGLSEPMMINLYENHISISDELTPRGLISPIADGALLSYQYELLEAYMEDGKLIDRIRVIPRRKFEPLFSGVIEIIHDEWRLHAADLLVDKDHQLDVIDSMFIKQIFVPVGEVLMAKDQSFKVKLRLLGLGITGNFVQSFNNYSFSFNEKDYFNKFEKEFTKDALVKSTSYWDSTRLVPLDAEEQRDFVKKDSLRLVQENTKDTVKKKHRNSFNGILLSGSVWKLGKDAVLQVDPLLGVNSMNWNTAEGLHYSLGLRFHTTNNEESRWEYGLQGRYGFSNRQLNGKLQLGRKWGKTNRSGLQLSGGRYVFQYNNEDPVNPLLNTFYTLVLGRNYLKIYQAWFAQVHYEYKHVSGLVLRAQSQWQERHPLANTNLYSWNSDGQLSENYPGEKIAGFEQVHRALIGSVMLSYQPGRKYIRYPDRIVSVPSGWPVFGVELSVAPRIRGVSDVSYSKWQSSISDQVKLKLWGTLHYRLRVGGFFGLQQAYLADYTHFNGNRMLLASPYLNSFQLAPYYAHSNTEALYTTLNAEHHFYGLLSNKIPLFRKLKWYLVGACNMYYVNAANNYIEASIGLENIGYRLARFLRVDGIAGFSNLNMPVYGVRVGINSTVIRSN